MPTDTANFSFWTTVAFTLNYILGSGFLTLPWGFQQTGVLLGVFVLIIFGFLSTLSVFFILESIHRGQILFRSGAVVSIELSYMKSNKRGYVAVSSPSSSTSEATLSPLSREQDEVKADFQTQIVTEPTAEPEDRKIELSELCRIFLGPIGAGTYTAIIALYMYGTLWAYATVFANAFAAYLDIGANSYGIYLVVFAIFVIPISLMEFSEQIQVQVALSIFRVLMVTVMVITILTAYGMDDDEFSLGITNESRSSATKFAPAKLYLLMPVAAYAYIFHHSVPSLAHSTRNKDTLTHLFRTAVVISAIAYILVGVVVSLYFGSETLTSSNLSWEMYVGVRRKDQQVAVYADVIAFFVVLFPAIDVASAFPLNAYTLGNNLMSAYYGNEMFRHQNSRWKLSLFRALAAVPPIFGALIESDLGKITGFTGLAAFGIAFIFPPLLAHFSAKTLDGMGIAVTTPHSSFWTTVTFQWLLLITGIITFVVVGVCFGVQP